MTASSFAGSLKIARFERGRRHGGRPEHVLLERHALEIAEAGRVVPGKVRVRLDHPGHQGRARAVDDRHAGRGQRARPAADAGDAVALDQDLARIRLGAGAVDDAHIGEEHTPHALLLYIRRA